MSSFQASTLRARAGQVSERFAQVELSRVAKAATGTFDIFLSHSSSDALAILGLKQTLEDRGLTVYVDWVVDPDLDRSQVTPATAALLRRRMRACTSLVYATSRNASTSRWMPWELGFFDGINGVERIAVCRIESGTNGNFAGEEYLGLYRTLEELIHHGARQPFVVSRDRAKAESARSFGKRLDQYLPIS